MVSFTAHRTPAGCATAVAGGLRRPVLAVILLGCILLGWIIWQRPVRADNGQAAGRIVDPALDHSIDNAIDLGVEYLLAEVQGPVGWVPTNDYPAGYLAVQLYALLKSDVSYLHPALQKGLELLEGYPLDKVYSVSLALMAYDAVLEQMDAEEEHGGTYVFLGGKNAGKHRAYRRKIERQMNDCLRWLLRARIPNRGVWSYELRRSRNRDGAYDHSNTQFAILALGVAARRGLRVPTDVWAQVGEHFSKVQETEGPVVEDRPEFRPRDVEEESLARRRAKRSPTVRVPAGEKLYQGGVEVKARGWGYTAFKPDTTTTFSMTSAGQSSVLLAHLYLKRAGGQDARVKALETVIRDGYGWLTKHLGDGGLRANTYDLYSLEKVGDIGEVEAFGDFRWFEAGARILTGTQGDRGQWGRPQSTPSRYKTALALLYLGRASSLEKSHGLVRYTGSTDRETTSFANRYFVHLQSVGASVPMIRFFRKLRYTPDERLLAMSEELIEAYDPDYRDELVAFFRTLELSPYPKIKERCLPMLERVTGLKLEKSHLYLDWARRWQRVTAAGLGRALDDALLLRQWLRDSESQPLKLKIIWALQQMRDLAAVETLIELMASEDVDFRRAAYDAAVVISGKRFFFDPEGTSEKREPQVERWRVWWKEAGAEAALGQ